MAAKKSEPTPRECVEVVIVLAHSLALFDVEERLQVAQGIPHVVAEVVALYEAAVALAGKLAEDAGGLERRLKLARAALRAVSDEKAEG